MGWAQHVAATSPTRSRPQMITTCVEHQPVSHCADYLESQGWEIVSDSVRYQGMVPVDSIQKYIGRRTRLISVQLANQDIGSDSGHRHNRSIASSEELCAAHRCKPSDGKDSRRHFQFEYRSAFDQFSFDVWPQGDRCSLYRNGVMIKNILHGGYQETRIASGTLNTMAVVGFGAAAQMVTAGGIDLVNAQNRLSQDSFTICKIY